jgi:hypothetical protein
MFTSVINHQVRILERPANVDLESFGNSLYLTIVTMSTVGYGEIAPITVGGQVVMIVGGIIGGVLILSMMTAIVIDTLQLSEEEEKVLDNYHRVKESRDLRIQAASVIECGWRLYALGGAKKGGRPARLFEWIFYNQIHKFRILRKGIYGRQSHNAAGVNMEELVSAWDAKLRRSTVHMDKEINLKMVQLEKQFQVTTANVARLLANKKDK